jgi:hypothetical protein
LQQGFGFGDAQFTSPLVPMCRRHGIAAHTGQMSLRQERRVIRFTKTQRCLAVTGFGRAFVEEPRLSDVAFGNQSVASPEQGLDFSPGQAR